MNFLGDVDPDATYAAVGRALSSWEQLEENIANLYSMFAGMPHQLETIRYFGDNARTFGIRMMAIKGESEKYFAAHPSQDNEGCFAAICDRADYLAKHRNRIAHGVVSHELVFDLSGGPMDNPPSAKKFILKAPWYSAARLKMYSRGAYGSKEILLAADEFIELQKQCAELIATLSRA